MSSSTMAFITPIPTALRTSIHTPRRTRQPTCWRTSFTKKSFLLQPNSSNLSSPLPPQMRMSGGSGSTPPAPIQERLLSILPYIIPVLDSLSFGKYVFAKVPILESVLLVPLFPIYSLYRGIPFLAFGVFLALYLLVVRNTNISRYIRFNTYQALIIDIALIFPQLFAGLNLGGVIPATVAEICTTAVFYAAMLAVLYAVVSNAKGQVPDEIPAISDSVYQQMGPY